MSLFSRKFDAALPLDISYHIRVAMFGDAGVGKTSLLLRYTEDIGRTSPEHMVDMRTKMLVRSGHRIKLDVQDTAGLERYRSLTKSHYCAITGALLVFDLTKEMSFQHILYWHEELQRNSGKSVQEVLVGTHCHKKEDHIVSEESIKRLTDHLEIQYVEVSSEKNINVEQCFEILVDKIIEKHSERVKVPGKEITLGDDSEDAVSCSRCCTALHHKEPA